MGLRKVVKCTLHVFTVFIIHRFFYLLYLFTIEKKLPFTKHWQAIMFIWAAQSCRSQYRGTGGSSQAGTRPAGVYGEGGGEVR
jgi:hypothetical protein